MNDPTRIDSVLARVKEAWEGQPELSLVTLFGMLSNEGFGWGTTDEQLIEALDRMALIHPSHFPVKDDRGVWLLEALDPNTKRRILVTLDNSTAVVEHRAAQNPIQPVVWDYTGIRPTSPLRPLVIADVEGFEHRLGILQRITRLDCASVRIGRVNRLCCKELGERVYVVQTEFSTVRIGSRMEIFSKGRREISYRSVTWQELLQCEVGKPLAFVNSQGEREVLEAVIGLVIAQAPSLQLGGLDA